MNGRRVLVTGSSRGIGRQIALKLGEEGWKVATHYVNQAEEAHKVETELDEAAHGCYRADLSEADGPNRLWQAALADGPIHALVNNAGIYVPQSFMAPTEAFEATFAKTWAINFVAPVKLMRLAIEHFERTAPGSIVNVASRVGFRGEANASIYAASKAALINLTRSLAVELAPKQIGVFGIAPGWVDTAMSRNGMDERMPEILAGIPLGRMASPSDCAAVVAFLLSKDAAYLSGMVIDINGASYFH